MKLIFLIIINFMTCTIYGQEQFDKIVDANNNRIKEIIEYQVSNHNGDTSLNRILTFDKKGRLVKSVGEFYWDQNPAIQISYRYNDDTIRYKQDSVHMIKTIRTNRFFDVAK